MADPTMALVNYLRRHDLLDTDFLRESATADVY